MSTGLYDAVGSMAVAEKRLEMIATNIANASTNGFKRKVGSTVSFEQVVNGQTKTGQALVTQTEFEQGEIVRTGNSLELAMNGPGFFTFEGEEGEMYSRDGTLRLTEEGELVSKFGMPVAWEGPTGAIDPTVGRQLRFDGEGNVYQGAEEIGQLKLSNFDKPERLVLDNEGFYHNKGGVSEEPVLGTLVQNAVEAANVNPVTQMVEMILAQRAYESASNTVSQLADSYKKLTTIR
jgi:flagellar basal-body rod protein FlgF